ncbi:MAG: pilus assembly protein TadG-related protein [Pseudomonadota bacterium]|nr:pilus assembly protein TadG-related protein [Pseudomonadota bacterium]
MFNFLRKLFKDKRGNALIIAAAAMPLMIGSAGLATDTIQWAMWKRQLQRAADSAAIAGVYDRANNSGLTSTTSTAVSHDLSLNQHTGLSLQAGYPQISYPTDTTTKVDQVTVTLAVQRKLSFSGMFMTNPPLIKTTATAASVPGTDDMCVLSLENNAATTGISITGNAGMELDCSLMSNSPSNNSAYAKGSSTVTANSVAAVGGIQQSSNWNVQTYQPYSPALADPFANVNPVASDMNCKSAALSETTNLALTDASGKKYNCFSSLSVSPNKTLTLPDGTYYINGGDAFIQGNITCSSCTIVLTNSSTASNATIGSFKVNATANINLNAPASGTYKGIAIFQDRRATNNSNKINGNSSSIINGAVYFPKSSLDYNGTGTSSATCTQLVARDLTFSGNSSTSNKFKKAANCAAYGNTIIQGGKRVRLVA